MVLMFLWVLRWMFRRMLRGFRSRPSLRFRCRLRSLSVLRFAARLNLPCRWRCGSGRGGFARRRRRVLAGRIHVFLGSGVRLRRRILACDRVCFGCRTRRAQPWLWRWAIRTDGCIAGRCRGVACGNRIGEISRARSRRNRGTTMIAGGAQFWIAARSLHLLSLRRRRFDMSITRGRGFCRGGFSANAAIAAIETDSRYADVVHDRLVVDVRDVHGTDIHDGAIVEEVPALPIAALITASAIAETIVDAAVESDLRTPVSFVPHEDGAIGRPVTGCP